MRLFIAEKPSAAKAIADVLGNAERKEGFYQCGDTAVSYCVGHLFEQEEPDAYLSDDVPKNSKGSKKWRLEDLPIIPDEWKYKVKPKTKSQLSVLGKLIKKADLVVNAGDLDREGQAIIDHVLEYFNCNVPVKRFCVSAQDAVSIQRGLDNLQDNAEYKGWRDASVARQRADWLVGMNLSRSFTLEAQAKGQNTLLVVGRVQSPTLALVVKRDRAIENFKPKDYYTVEARASVDLNAFIVKWIPAKESAFLDEEGRIVNEEIAKKAETDLEDAEGIVSKFETDKKNTAQPLGLSLSDVTLLSSNKYGYSAEQTLATVQSLYETHKLVSYPRSDCRYLPESQLEDAETILKAIGETNPKLSSVLSKADTGITSRIFNDKKITAHHAIVPSMQKGKLDDLNEAEARLYEIICLRYIAQFYPKQEYEQTVIEIETTSVAIDDQPYVLGATSRRVTLKGWKEVYQGSDSDESEEEEYFDTLPHKIIENGVILDHLEIIPKKTTPPKHFTEGTLIKALEQIHKYIDDDEYRKLLKEEDGIGTPATRSQIIGELKRRKYLTTKGKNLLSTEEGKRLIDILPESVTSPVLTAQYERMLHEIQNDGGSLDEFITKQVNYILEQISSASALVAAVPAPASKDSSKPAVKCPDCEKQLIRRKNSFKKSGFWWGCSGYPDCTARFPDKAGKPDFKAQKPASEETEFKCPECDAALIARVSAKGNTWYGCSSFPKCSAKFFEKDGAPNIPEKA